MYITHTHTHTHTHTQTHTHFLFKIDFLLCMLGIYTYIQFLWHKNKHY